MMDNSGSEWMDFSTRQMMKKFRTDSTDHSGKKHSQVLEANDERDVVSKLKIAGLSPVKIEEINNTPPQEAPDATPQAIRSAESTSAPADNPQPDLDTFVEWLPNRKQMLNTVTLVVLVVFAICSPLFSENQGLLIGIGGACFFFIIHHLSMIFMNFMQACAEGLQEIRDKQ